MTDNATANYLYLPAEHVRSYLAFAVEIEVTPPLVPDLFLSLTLQPIFLLLPVNAPLPEPVALLAIVPPLQLTSCQVLPFDKDN